MKPFTNLGLFAAALTWAMFSGCDKSDVAGTSTETISGKTTGLIFLAGGKPAAGAKVRFLPTGYRPYEDSGNSEVFRTTTNDKGRYYVEGITKGEYNILAESNGEVSLQDSVPLNSTPRELASDTLAEAGSVSGFIALQSGDPLPTVTIQLLGTQAFSNVDARGFFTLPALAAGRYRAAVSTTLPDYTARYVSLEIQSGRNDTLADTLRPIFTGIPQVHGVKAVFDTLNQAVTLAWPDIGYSGTDVYLVFRDRKGAVRKSSDPIVTVSDTQVTDFLPSSLSIPVEGRYTVDVWEYRVVIRDQFGIEGRSYGSTQVNAPSSSHVTTFLESRIANAESQESGLWRAGIGDTVFAILHATNRTRAAKLVRWFQNGNATPIRSSNPGAREFLDTLRIICPGNPATLRLRAEVADDAGAEWMQEMTLNVVTDAPIVNLPAEYSGKPGDSIRVTGSVSDRYGKIVKLEWKFGTAPFSAPTLSNDTVIIASEIGWVNFSVILKATDDDGNAVSDTAYINVNPWVRADDMPEPASGMSVVTLSGKAYAMGGLKVSANEPLSALRVLDAVSGTWSLKRPMPAARTNFCAATVNGRIYVMAGSSNGMFLSQTLEYNPASDEWTPKADIPHPRVDGDVAVYNGKIYVIGGYVPDPVESSKPTSQIDVYDPASDSWTSFSSLLPVWGALKTATIGNEVYAFAAGKETNGQFAKYDLPSDTWTHLGTIPKEADKGQVRPFDFSVIANAGKILLMGGVREAGYVWWVSNGREFTRHSFEYIPGIPDWNEILALPRAVSGAGMAVMDDRLYLFGGTVSTTRYFPEILDSPTDKWSDTDETYRRGLP